MPSNDELMERARAQARTELSQDESFRQLSQTEQFEKYKNRIDRIYNYLINQSSGNGKLTGQQDLSGAMAASDLINKKQLQNDRIDNQGEIAGRVLDRVNFPKFVTDLLTGVFDANLKVTQAQMDKYAEMVDRIVKPATEFVQSIDDSAAMLYIAQKQPNRFKLEGGSDDGFEGLDDDSNASADKKSAPPMKLMNASGGEVDQTEVQREIMKAKLELVEQHQKLLEQMLLMGITRMVVDSGKIKASVDFIIRASEKVQQLQDAQENRGQQSGYMRNRSWGVGGFFSLFGGGITEQTTEQNVQTMLELSTAGAASVTNTQSQTKLHGEVEINFKSDYFPLANFKEILTSSQQPPNQQKPNPEQPPTS